MQPCRCVLPACGVDAPPACHPAPARSRLPALRNPPLGRRLRAVPEAILRGCASLATLSLHGNAITVDQLRETPGWAEFDGRRKAKYDKQVGGLEEQAGWLASLAGAMCSQQTGGPGEALCAMHAALVRCSACAVGAPLTLRACPASPPRPLQVEMRVLVNSGGFDEGAEAEEFEHWLE